MISPPPKLLFAGILVVAGCQEIAGPVSALQKSCATQADCFGVDSVCHRGNCLTLVAVCDSDGLVEVGEGCDDGNKDDFDACTSGCRRARCGDGFRRLDLQAGEAGFEACDDGNGVDADGCLNDCSEPRCGDGVLRLDLQPDTPGYEACDDGNLVDTDGCTSRCSLPTCGDGFRDVERPLGEPGYEACDDGNDDNGDDCISNCELAACGDGHLRRTRQPTEPGYEACDDGNADDGDACLSNCQVAQCGDGVVWSGLEACDDGNRRDDDGCRVDCTLSQCGDGIVAEGVEECDDGNALENDACRSNCLRARCGDGILRTDLTQMSDLDYEGCEPSLDNGRLYCRPDCRFGEPPAKLVLHLDGICVYDHGNIHCRNWSDQPGDPVRLMNSQPREILGLNQSAYRSICTIDQAGQFACYSQLGEGWSNVLTFAIDQAVVDVSYNWEQPIQSVVTRQGQILWWGGHAGVLPRPQIIARPILGIDRAISIHSDRIALDEQGQLHALTQGSGEEITDRFARAYPRHEPLLDLVEGLPCIEGHHWYCALGRDGQAYGVTENEVIASDRFGGQPIHQMAGARDSVCVILDVPERTVKCTGGGRFGALGQGNELDHRDSAVTVTGFPRPVEISGSYDAYCIRSESDEVWCWGNNQSNRLIPQDDAPLLSPRRIPGFPPPAGDRP